MFLKVLYLRVELGCVAGRVEPLSKELVVLLLEVLYVILLSLINGLPLMYLSLQLLGFSRLQDIALHEILIGLICVVFLL